MKKKPIATAIYNLQSFEDAAVYAGQNFKDAGGIVLARNLQHLSAEIFTQEYPDLVLLNQGITVNNEGGYATSIQKLKLGISGDFREAGTNTDTNGKITLIGEDDTIPVFTLDAHSEWSEMELKQAELQNVSLPARMIGAHNQRYNEKIDEIGFLGQVRTNGTQKTTGLLNYANWDSDNAAGTAAALTPTELYQEIADLITRQWANVFNTTAFMADRVLMPDTVYNIASTKILNSAGSEMSVLAALRANFPTVTFGLTTKSRSVGGSSVTVAFSTNRQGMQLRIPVPLNVSSIDQRGWKYYFESFFSIAGLDVIEDGAAAILRGL
jgi:hypothetical protein